MKTEAGPLPPPLAANAVLNRSLCFLSGAALISQMLGAREVLALTGGNEIVLGLVFGAWFLWSGAGAAVAGWLRLGQRFSVSGLGAVATIGAGWLPLLQVLLLRACACWLENGDGRLTGIWQAVAAAGLLLAPPPLFCGACFAALAAVRVLGAPASRRPVTSPQEERETTPNAGGTPALPEGASAVAASFSWDAIGAALAGAVFTFVLAGRSSAIQTGLALATLGCAGASWVWIARRQHFLACAACLPLLLTAPAVWTGGVAEELERATLCWRPRFAADQEKFIAERESRYQQLLLTEYRGQYTVYGDGEALATYPDQESTAAEVHFVASQAPQLRRVLVAGAAPGSTIRELLRYRPERVDVIEFDAQVLKLLWDKLSLEDRAALNDPAVRLHTGDVARFLFDAPAGDYDLVWLHPPAPSSIQTNRFYTAEFFGRAARVLSGRGVLTFSTTGAPSYLGPVLWAYLGSIRGALQAAFPVVRELPGSAERFLAASQSGVLPASPEEAVARFAGRAPAVPNFAPEIFFTMWEPEQEAQRALDFDAGTARPPPANTNRQPSAMRAYLAIWDRFAGADRAEHGDGAPLPAAASRPWPASILVGLAVLLFVFIAWLLFRRSRASRRLAPQRPRVRCASVLVAGLSGAVAIALELCLLNAYQAACGHVYERLALVSGLYMLGLAAGNRWAASLLKRVPPPLAGAGRGRAHAAIASQIALLVTSGLSGLVFWDVLSPTVVELLVAFLTLAFAVAAGVQLPLLAALAEASGDVQPLPEQPETSACASPCRARSVSAILAADYAGATLGALSTGTFLLPCLGAFLALAAVCGCAAVALAVLIVTVQSEPRP
ncbi:MAG: hypothetical protein ABSE73_02000 [Planctomycetota bacterium]